MFIFKKHYIRLMKRLEKVEADVHAGFTGHMAKLEELGRNPGGPGNAVLLQNIQNLRPHHIGLSEHEIAVRTLFGFYLVVPSYNIDVAPGILRDGIIEPWTTNVVMSLLKPGMTYVNVGANFGYYAAFGATQVGTGGKVLAVEANPYVFCYLIKSAYWAGCSYIISPYNFVAHDVDGVKIDFKFDPQFLGGGSIFNPGPQVEQSLGDCLWTGKNITNCLDGQRRFVTRGHFVAVEAEGRTLDSVFSGVEKVDVLHMDIEGSEPKAIMGARGMISKNEDISILVEWEGGRLGDAPFASDAGNALAFLESRGFIPYKIDVPAYKGLGTPPGFIKYGYQDLAATGHCDLLFTKKLRFDAVVSEYRA